MEELKNKIEDKIKELTPTLHKEARLKRRRRAELFQERILSLKEVLKWINEIEKKTQSYPDFRHKLK